MDFAISADHRLKLTEIEKKDKYLRSCERTEKTTERVSDGDSNVIGPCGKVYKEVVKRLKGFKIKGRAEIVRTTALLRSA